jgi:nucleotide-binding universal stress UspA family protein
MRTGNNKTIIAAVDTSLASRSVLKEALVLASSTRSKIILIAVTPQYEGNMNRMCIDDAEREFTEPFRKVLEEAADYASSLGVKLKTVHRTGKPSFEILAAAVENKASLIILGGAKRNQVERMLLGRTSAAIIAEAPCDVLLIPENTEIRFRRLLVGVSGTIASEEAIRRAIEVAESYGSEIHGLYAIDTPPDRALRYGVQKDAEQKARVTLEKFRAMVQAKEIPVVTATAFTSPEKALADYSASHDIHLIVLGTNPSPSLFDMFRESINEAVSSRALCPVLVAKKHTVSQPEEAAVSHFS